MHCGASLHIFCHSLKGVAAFANGMHGLRARHSYLNGYLMNMNLNGYLMNMN